MALERCRRAFARRYVAVTQLAIVRNHRTAQSRSRTNSRGAAARPWHSPDRSEALRARSGYAPKERWSPRSGRRFRDRARARRIYLPLGSIAFGPNCSPISWARNLAGGRPRWTAHQDPGRRAIVGWWPNRSPRRRRETGIAGRHAGESSSPGVTSGRAPPASPTLKASNRTVHRARTEVICDRQANIAFDPRRRRSSLAHYRTR
jgi:hypothetical protein